MAKRATTLGDKCLVVWLYGRVPILGVFGHSSLETERRRHRAVEGRIGLRYVRVNPSRIHIGHGYRQDRGTRGRKEEGRRGCMHGRLESRQAWSHLPASGPITTAV